MLGGRLFEKYCSREEMDSFLCNLKKYLKIIIDTAKNQNKCKILVISQNAHNYRDAILHHFHGNIFNDVQFFCSSFMSEEDVDKMSKEKNVLIVYTIGNSNLFQKCRVELFSNKINDFTLITDTPAAIPYNDYDIFLFDYIEYIIDEDKVVDNVMRFYIV